MWDLSSLTKIETVPPALEGEVLTSEEVHTIFYSISASICFTSSLLESEPPSPASINMMQWKWCTVNYGNQLQENFQLLFLPFTEQTQISYWLTGGMRPSLLIIPADRQPPLQRSPCKTTKNPPCWTPPNPDPWNDNLKNTVLKH